MINVDHDGAIVVCLVERRLDCKGGGVNDFWHDGDLYVENEFLFSFAENQESHCKSDGGYAKAYEIFLDTRKRVVHSNVSEVADVVIHGVERLGGLHPIGQKAYGVEKRCCVCPCRDDDAPKMADVAEENGQRGKQHTQTAAEQQHIYEKQR